MTSVRARLETFVDDQRRKQVLATLVAALVETVLVAALLFALLRLGLPNLVLTRGRKAALGVVVLVAFAIAFLVEQQRQVRSALFWAKRIDDANRLEDHFVTALSLPDPITSGFEQACLNALVLRLQTTQLRLPDVKLERVWLLAPAILVALGTGAVEWRRRARPQDDGRSMVVLPGDLERRMSGILEDDKLTPAAAKAREAAEKLQKTFADIAGKQMSKESVLQRVDALNEQLGALAREGSSITQAALQLGDPSTQRAQSLLASLQKGDPSGTSQALDTLAKVLSGETPPPLGPEERAEIVGILEQLSKLSQDPALGKALQDAAAAMGDPARGAEAGKAIAAVRPQLVDKMTREQATDALRRKVRELVEQTHHEIETQTQPKTLAAGFANPNRADGGMSLGASEAPPATVQKEGAADDGDATVSTGGGPGMGAGAGAASAPDYAGGKPEQATTGKDVHVSSPWVGATVSQLVAAAAGSDKGAQTAVREQLGAQRRVAEREVRREEIPPEYAQAIQRYFFNLQQDMERTWKPSK